MTPLDSTPSSGQTCETCTGGGLLDEKAHGPARARARRDDHRLRLRLRGASDLEGEAAGAASRPCRVRRRGRVASSVAGALAERPGDADPGVGGPRRLRPEPDAGAEGADPDGRAADRGPAAPA